jgi:hypothetical protein
MDSPSVTIKQLQERVAKAAKVMCITEDTLWLFLGILGITKTQEDGLALLEADTTQEGDARRVMVEEGSSGYEKVGIARFKAGWAVLKGRTETNKICDNSQILSLLKTAEHMSDKELIEQYGPECTSNIIEELKRRSNDRSFVIFLDNEKVDVDNSLKLLRTARRQEIPSTFSIQTPNGNAVVKTYRIGEFPMLFLEECPLHKDTILVNGYCEDCRCNWENVSYDSRVMIRVALDTGHIKINNMSFYDLGNLIASFGASTSANGGVHPDTSMHPFCRSDYKQEFDDLKQENRLPVLRRKLSSDTKSDVYVQRRTY